MKTRIHAFAGGLGFLTILTFWTSTIISELFGSYEMIAAVKQLILIGMFILIPAMIIAGGSGMSIGGKRNDALALGKKKRMPLIAANGLLILLPSAFYLASKSAAGEFDNWFYGIQVLELTAGAANLTMMGLNIRDGFKMTGRIGTQQKISNQYPDGATLEVLDNGPLLTKGITQIIGADGKDIPVKSKMALCRCGASKNRPFCDGSHQDIEWAG